MKSDRIAAVLAFLNSKVNEKSKRSGWVVATCPFAPWTHSGAVDRSPSFGVSLPQSGKKQVYTCFSCGEKGLIDLLPFAVREYNREAPQPKGRYQFGKALQVIVAEDDELGDLDLPDFDEVKVNPDVIVPWPEFFLESFKSVFAFPEAGDYCLTRQMNAEVAKFLDLRYDSQRQRVCFPVRDFDGRLVGLHGRTITDHPMRYYAYKYDDHYNRLPWLGEAWVDFDKTVILCESVFDLASVLRVFPNTICALHTGLSEAKVRRIDHGGFFVSFFDHGTGGDRARELLDKYMTSPVKHVVPATGDPGDMSEGVVTDYLGPVINSLTNV